MLIVMAGVQATDLTEAALCDVVKRTGEFDGKLIEVRARLTVLDHNEFGIVGECLPPLLLVYPSEVEPSPFETEWTYDLDVLHLVQQHFAYYDATFVGRFDVAGRDPRTGKTKTFGKSKSPLRLVLRRVFDSRLRFPLRK
jgi:hypothetical protein